MTTATTVAAGLTLRGAVLADDAFLRHVYQSTREAELSGVSWDEATRQAFFAQQFDAQAADYRRRFPGARVLVVERDGSPVGRLYLADDGTAVHVLDIALLAEHRGHGLGEALLRWVIGEGKRVSLTVGKWNPAQRLYARLGFEVVADEGAYLGMERLPLS